MKKFSTFVGAAMLAVTGGAFLGGNAFAASSGITVETYGSGTVSPTTFTDTVITNSDNTATYDPATNTITLDGFAGRSLVIDSTSPVNIILKGLNSIENTNAGSVGIKSTSALTISGDGTLDIATKDSGIDTAKNLTINNGKFNISSGTGIKLASSSLTFNNGTLIIGSTYESIMGDGEKLYFGNGNINLKATSSDAIYYYNGDIVISGGAFYAEGKNAIEISDTTGSVARKLIIDNGEVNLKSNITGGYAAIIYNTIDEAGIKLGDGMYVVEDGVEITKSNVGASFNTFFGKGSTPTSSVTIKNLNGADINNANTADRVGIYIVLLAASIILLSLKFRRTSRL